MIIPVRCFSCGSVIGDKYEEFRARIQKKEDPKKALDSLGVKRYCCRRMLLSQIDVLEEVIDFDVKGE